MPVSHLGGSLKNHSRLNSGSCFCVHSRTAVSTSSSLRDEHWSNAGCRTYTNLLLPAGGWKVGSHHAASISTAVKAIFHTRNDLMLAVYLKKSRYWNTCYKRKIQSDGFHFQLWFTPFHWSALFIDLEETHWTCTLRTDTVLDRQPDIISRAATYKMSSCPLAHR